MADRRIVVELEVLLNEGADRCRAVVAEKDKRIAELEGNLLYEQENNAMNVLRWEERCKELEAENARLTRPRNPQAEARANWDY